MNGGSAIRAADLHQHFDGNAEHLGSFCDCEWQGAAFQPDPLCDSLGQEGGDGEKV